MLAVQARVVSALLRLAAECPDENIAIVSHAEPIRAALLFALGIPLDGWQRMEISVGSISTALFTAGQGFTVVRLNETVS
jgi:probable phosphoglycerate mutase